MSRTVTIDLDDPEVQWILGRPCFWVAPAVSNILKLRGDPIPGHAEEEQAMGIAWMLSKFSEHGASWREAGIAELAAIKEEYRAKLKAITTRNGLLFRHGEMVPLPEADSLAAQFGFPHAEAFVRALEKEERGP